MSLPNPPAPPPTLVPPRASWLHLNPKVKAALFAALAVAVVSVGNSILNVYPNEAWTQLLSTLIPVIAGYLKSA